MSDPTWPLRIVVPIDVQETAQNQRRHWRGEHKAKQKARRAGYFAWKDAGEVKITVPVRVSLIVRRRRVLDILNIPGASKAILDGVLVGLTLGTGSTRTLLPSLLPDDSARWVHLGSVEQYTGKQWADCPELELVIEPLERDGER